MRAHLLLIEDEPAITDFLTENLRHDEVRVTTAASLGEAAAQLRRHRPDILLVDIALPDGSGLDLCRRVREGEIGDPDVGIIFLTARAEEQDRVRGFHRGADDYVVKPFHYPELLGRINALHARLGGRRREMLETGPVAIDLSARTVMVDGERMVLPAKEFDLLAALARDPYRVHEKEELLERVWGYRTAGSTRTLDSHASRLRRRLEDRLAGDERWIVNHWGIGYALRAGGR